MKFRTTTLAILCLAAAALAANAETKSIVTPYTRLDPAKSALLVIDAQNDFADPEGAHPMPDAVTVMPRVLRAVDMYRRAGQPVIHVVRLYEADGANVDMCRKWQVETREIRLIVPGTWGSQIFPAINPTGAELDAKALLAGDVQRLTDREFVIYKPRFNGFVRTELDAFLKSLDINSVVIVGITFPNCVRATQLGATDHDYRVGLVPEACTETYPKGLDAMRGEGVQIMSLDDLGALVSGK